MRVLHSNNAHITFQLMGVTYKKVLGAEYSTPNTLEAIISVGFSFCAHLLKSARLVSSFLALHLHGVRQRSLSVP